MLTGRRSRSPSVDSADRHDGKAALERGAAFSSPRRPSSDAAQLRGASLSGSSRRASGRRSNPPRTGARSSSYGETRMPSEQHARRSTGTLRAERLVRHRRRRGIVSPAPLSSALSRAFDGYLPRAASHSCDAALSLLSAGMMSSSRCGLSSESRGRREAAGAERPPAPRGRRAPRGRGRREAAGPERPPR